MEMNKTLAAFICLLGLALGSIPAHANPTVKTITVSCSSDTTDVDEIIGFASITLCDAPDCSGQKYNCLSATQNPPLSSIDFVSAVCDNNNPVNGPISITVSCSPGFGVHGVIAVIGYVDATYPDAPQSTTHGPSALTGKGFFTTYGGQTPDADGDTDTVSLAITK
jgi:hypothetical protein